MARHIAHVEEPNDKAKHPGTEYWLVTDDTDPDIQMRFPTLTDAEHFAQSFERGGPEGANGHWYTKERD